MFRLYLAYGVGGCQVRGSRWEFGISAKESMECSVSQCLGVVKSDTRQCNRSSEKGRKGNAMTLGRCTGKRQNIGNSKRSK